MGVNKRFCDGFKAYAIEKAIDNDTYDELEYNSTYVQEIARKIQNRLNHICPRGYEIKDDYIITKYVDVYDSRRFDSFNYKVKHIEILDDEIDILEQKLKNEQKKDSDKISDASKHENKIGNLEYRLGQTKKKNCNREPDIERKWDSSLSIFSHFDNNSRELYSILLDIMPENKRKINYKFWSEIDIKQRKNIYYLIEKLSVDYPNEWPFDEDALDMIYFKLC